MQINVIRPAWKQRVGERSNSPRPFYRILAAKRPCSLTCVRWHSLLQQVATTRWSMRHVTVPPVHSPRKTLEEDSRKQAIHLGKDGKPQGSHVTILLSPTTMTSRPTSRASTIHSDERTEGPSFAFETPTPAPRPASRPGLDLATERALAPSLRSRRAGQSMVGQFDASPTGSVASTLVVTETPALPMQPLAGRQKITIRSDPGLFTCFDPKDKELYDLWAPKA